MSVETIKQTQRARYEHALARTAARETHEARLLLTAQGGTFKITHELLGFLSLVECGDTVILLDIYDNPVQVDRHHLLSSATERYREVMSDWYDTVNLINKQR